MNFFPGMKMELNSLSSIRVGGSVSFVFVSIFALYMCDCFIHAVECGSEEGVLCV